MSASEAFARLDALMSREPDRPHPATPVSPDPYSPPWWAFHDAWIAHIPIIESEDAA